MPRKRSRRKPYKPYEKRVDLADYQRLMRFLRWMNPQLSAEDALRMLPESDAWSARQLKERARTLDKDLTQPRQLPRPFPLRVLIPYIVANKWGWPVKTPDGRYLQGTRLVAAPTLPYGEVIFPILLKNRYPTIKGLCRLASDLRKPLQYYIEGKEAWAGGRIATAIEGRIVLRLVRTRERGFQWTNEVEDLDFRVYCFWLLGQLLVEGHAWRVACCVQCAGFFLKTRRDPPDRPSRFCSEQCRRDWHNPRRPKKGKDS
jgi:hypothetical protein